MATTTKKKTTTPRKTAPTKPSTGKAVKTPTSAAKPPMVKVTPDADAPALRKKELIERVVIRSGIKKKDAKPTIEAMLAILGEALAAGEELNLQPLGKVMVKREKELPNAKVMVCRIRQRKVSADSTTVKIAPNS